MKGKEVLISRIEQELEYGNYSEVKRIALTILRTSPENKDASYIRNFIEYHKKSNGRYGNISFGNYLRYILNNIEKFKQATDNKIFLRCVCNDPHYTEEFDYSVDSSTYIISSLQTRIDEINKVLELLKQLNNPDLDDLIGKLTKIQNDFSLRLEVEQKEEQKRKEREKTQKDTKITVWAIVIAILVFLVIIGICSSGS